MNAKNGNLMMMENLNRPYGSSVGEYYQNKNGKTNEGMEQKQKKSIEKKLFYTEQIILRRNQNEKGSVSGSGPVFGPGGLLLRCGGRQEEPRGRHDRGLHPEGLRQLLLRAGRGKGRDGLFQAGGEPCR